MSKRYEDIYTQNYYDQYSVGNGHEGYEDSKYTKDFLKNIAGRIYEDRKPESVLDVGCAMGYLVEALRDLGVEAYGVDVSEYAISKVREDLKPFCKAASALEELPEGFPRHFDLVTAIEVAEDVRRGRSFSEITARIPSLLANSHVFFSVDTLEYLQKGCLLYTSRCV